MPAISEKLKLETAYSQTVRLWPEGTFYKVYERSAYLFVTRLRPYKVKRRYVDKVGGDVVSTAFPRTVLGGLGVDYQKNDDETVTIRLDCCIDEQQFLQWRNALPLTAQPQPAKRQEAARPLVASPMPEAQPMEAESPAVPDPAETLERPVSVERMVADRIRTFGLASATPIDCMLLLSELQRILLSEGR